MGKAKANPSPEGFPAWLESYPEIAHPKKRAFLAAYSDMGIIGPAAEFACIDRRTYFFWLAESERENPTPEAIAFKDAAKHAQELANDKLEAECIRRARNGTDEPVFQGGKLVGKIKKYSDLLLIFALKANRPDKFRDNVEIVHRYEKLSDADVQQRLNDYARRGGMKLIEGDAQVINSGVDIALNALPSDSKGSPSDVVAKDDPKDVDASLRSNTGNSDDSKAIAS